MFGDVMVWLALTAGAAGNMSAPPQEPPSLQCEVGPLHRIYGGTPWLVYSCSDGASLVVVSDKGNPAAPFYFMIYAQDDSYQLGGEGTRVKQVTDAAFEDLKTLTPDAIADLVRETRSPEPSKSSDAGPALPTRR